MKEADGWKKGVDHRNERREGRIELHEHRARLSDDPSCRETTGTRGETTGKRGASSGAESEATGPSDPTSGASRARIGRAHETTGESGPTIARCREITGEVGPTTSRSRETTGEVGPTIGRCREIAGEVGPTIGRCREITGEVGPTIGRIRTTTEWFGETSGLICETVARYREMAAQVGEPSVIGGRWAGAMTAEGEGVGPSAATDPSMIVGGHVAITAPPDGQRLRLHTSRANSRSSIDLAYLQLRAAGVRWLRAVGGTALARLMPCSDDSKAGSQIDRIRSIAADALICRHDGRPSGTITRRSLHGGLTRR